MCDVGKRFYDKTVTHLIFTVDHFNFAQGKVVIAKSDLNKKKGYNRTTEFG